MAICVISAIFAEKAALKHVGEKSSSTTATCPSVKLQLFSRKRRRIRSSTTASWPFVEFQQCLRKKGRESYVENQRLERAIRPLGLATRPFVLFQQFSRKMRRESALKAENQAIVCFLVLLDDLQSPCSRAVIAGL